MRRIECDKCGRDDLATASPERFAVDVRMPTGRTRHVDLCEDCQRRLRTWLAESDPQAAPGV